MVPAIQPRGRQQPASWAVTCPGEWDVGASGQAQKPRRNKETLGCHLKSAPILGPEAPWGGRPPPRHARTCSADEPCASPAHPSPSPDPRVLPTWHDDIRKSQFSRSRQSPIKYHGVFSPNLLHVSTKKLQRNDKPCKDKSIFLLRTTLPPWTAA